MTPTEKDDLVERLKERSQIELADALDRKWWLGQKGNPVAPIIEDMLSRQAATLITELQADYNDCREELQIEQDRVLELTRELAEAREALKPFVKIHDQIEFQMKQLGGEWRDTDATQEILHIRDLRRAARALGDKTP